MNHVDLQFYILRKISIIMALNGACGDDGLESFQSSAFVIQLKAVFAKAFQTIGKMYRIVMRSICRLPILGGAYT